MSQCNWFYLSNKSIIMHLTIDASDPAQIHTRPESAGAGKII
jgi:hypothetical protein